MIKKKDKICLIIVSSIFILVVVFLMCTNNYNVNYEIPEYFRNLFYDTKNLFPTFARNINNGENIFNYVSYGLYSPIILFSYLLPFLSMKLYLTIIEILFSFISILLFYYFLRNNKYDEKISLIGTISFIALLSIFNSINMVFIVMALIGIDKYYKSNKKILLMISIFLMIITNIGNCILSIITILIYAIYKYYVDKKKYDKKYIINTLLTFIFPILMCSFLIIPTLFSQYNLFQFDISFSTSVYKIFSIIIISIIVLFDNGKRENKILSIVLFVLLIFRINDLVSLIPLYCFLICNSISVILKNKIDIKKIIAYLIFVVITLIILNGIGSTLFYLEIVLLLLVINYRFKYTYILFIIYLLFYCFINNDYKNINNNSYEFTTLSSYASSNTFNQKRFNEYEYPFTNEILLKYVVTNDGEDINFKTKIKEFYIKASDIKYLDPHIEKDNYNFNVKSDNSLMIINIPKKARNKVLFISFDLSGEDNITINNIKNKDNHYELYEKNLTKVNILFDKGNYSINNLKLYYLDYDILESSENIDIDLYNEISINKEKYIASNILYNKNIIIKSNGKVIDYEKVNSDYVGFKLEPGKYNLNISINSKELLVSFIISFISLLFSIYFVFFKRK